MTYIATTASLTEREELLIPLHSGLIVCAGRGDERETFLFVRIDVLHPEAVGILRAHVGLIGLIGPRKRVRKEDEGHMARRTRSYP